MYAGLNKVPLILFWETLPMTLCTHTNGEPIHLPLSVGRIIKTKVGIYK